MLFIGVLLVLILAAGGWYVFNSSYGAPSGPPKKIGIIVPIPIIDAYKDGFIEGMKDLGYVEGKDVVFDVQEAGGDPQKIAQAVADITSANDIDLIFALTDSAGRSKIALDQLGKQTPVIFVGVEEPVAAKLVADYKSSENNFTGIVGGLSIVTGKKLEFLQKLMPAAKKLGVFSADIVSRQPGPPVYASVIKDAPALGFEIVPIDRINPGSPITLDETQRMADSIQSGSVDAIFHIPGHTLEEQEFIEPKASIRLKVPDIGGIPIEVHRGALYSYSPDFFDVGKQASIMADKILKGTAPKDIPVEQPRKYLLAFNLETARTIGVTIPSDLEAITAIRY